MQWIILTDRPGWAPLTRATDKEQLADLAGRVCTVEVPADPEVTDDEEYTEVPDKEAVQTLLNWAAVEGAGSVFLLTDSVIIVAAPDDATVTALTFETVRTARAAPAEVPDYRVRAAPADANEDEADEADEEEYEDDEDDEDDNPPPKPYKRPKNKR